MTPLWLAATKGLVMTPNKITFLLSAAHRKHFPPTDLPDVAVAGRSNVGKSSLINSLFGRKNLARVSRHPGRTRLINFFQVGDDFLLADLPGYGYARRSKAERESWRILVESYLFKRDTLAVMLMLIDIRRGVQQEEVLLMNTLAQQGVHAIAVLTKSDKFSKSKRRVRAIQIAKELGALVVATVCFSSNTGEGREQLWAAIQKQLKPHP